MDPDLRRRGPSVGRAASCPGGAAQCRGPLREARRYPAPGRWARRLGPQRGGADADRPHGPGAQGEDAAPHRAQGPQRAVGPLPRAAGDRLAARRRPRHHDRRGRRRAGDPVGRADGAGAPRPVAGAGRGPPAAAVRHGRRGPGPGRPRPGRAHGHSSGGHLRPAGQPGGRSRTPSRDRPRPGAGAGAPGGRREPPARRAEHRARRDAAPRWGAGGRRSGPCTWSRRRP